MILRPLLSRTTHDAQNAVVHELDDGTTLVWELLDAEPADALLAAPVDVKPGWLMRHDRIDFPPGGIAYRHTHPGPGIRYLLHGSPEDRVALARRTTYGPGEAWFESGPEPVLATASDDRGDGVRPRAAAARRSGRASGRSATSTPPTRSARSSSARPCTASTRSRFEPRTAARILVDQLLVHGVDTAYCVPGESYLGVLDAIGDSPIRLVHDPPRGGRGEHGGRLRQADRPAGDLPRHARARARPTPRSASTPRTRTRLRWCCSSARCRARHLGREAFQELDYTRMFGEMAKWVTSVDDAAAIPELVAHAFHTATSGRPGPVVIALPEDVAGRRGRRRRRRALPPGAGVARRPTTSTGRSSSSPAAERPLLVVGGGGWSEQAGRDVIAFAEASNVPVVASFRRQDYVDNASPAYAGPLTIGMDPKLAQRVRTRT